MATMGGARKLPGCKEARVHIGLNIFGLLIYKLQPLNSALSNHFFLGAKTRLRIDNVCRSVSKSRNCMSEDVGGWRDMYMV